MKRWWQLYQITSRWDLHPGNPPPLPEPADKAPVEPDLCALRQVHETLLRQVPPAPDPPADLATKICEAVRRAQRPCAVPPEQTLRIPWRWVWVPIGCILLISAMAWLRNQPRELQNPIFTEHPHVWISEAQLQAQAWAREVFEPDLARLQEEWDRTREEVRMLAAHVWASVP